MAKRWTEDEIDYLETQYGILPVSTIAKRLGRTESAIISKAKTLGMALMTATGMVTASELAKCMGVHRKIAYIWLKKGLKHRRKTLNKKTFCFVDIKEFWKWAEQNKESINFAKMERGVLIPEPDWLNEAYLQCVQKFPKRHSNDWTQTEEKTLVSMREKGISFDEIAENLGRTKISVKSRHDRLVQKGIAAKERCRIPWTQIEVDMLISMDKQRLPDKEIAEELGREVYEVRYKRKNLRDKGIHVFRKRRAIGG